MSVERPLKLYIALVAVSGLLMTYQGQAGPLRPLAFLSSPVNYLNLTASNLWGMVTEAARAVGAGRGENERLRRELYALRLVASRADELRRENRRLAEALGIKDSEPGFVALGRAVGRGSGRWVKGLLFDRGSDDAIEKDMPVITPDGLLGKVQDASAGFSTVLLIDDERFSASVRIGESRAEAILSGAGEGLCRLRYLPVREPIAVGDVLYTSGLDEMFPPGLRAAYVTRVETSPDAMFHEVWAVPFARIKRVEEAVFLRR